MIILLVSSTTIEEALNYLKPVILYSYLDKYNFFLKKNIIYRNTKNIGNLLKKISDEHPFLINNQNLINIFGQMM